MALTATLCFTRSAGCIAYTYIRLGIRSDPAGTSELARKASGSSSHAKLSRRSQLTRTPFRASARVGQPVKVDYFRTSLLRRSKIPPPGNSPTPTDGRRHRSRVHKPPFPHDGMVFVERLGAVKAALFLRDDVEPGR